MIDSIVYGYSVTKNKKYVVHYAEEDKARLYLEVAAAQLLFSLRCAFRPSLIIVF